MFQSPCRLLIQKNYVSLSLQKEQPKQQNKDYGSEDCSIARRWNRA